MWLHGTSRFAWILASLVWQHSIQNKLRTCGDHSTEIIADLGVKDDDHCAGSGSKRQGDITERACANSVCHVNMATASTLQ